MRKVGRDVVVNVPKLVIGKMPWDEPPSAAGQMGKRGPRFADGERLYGSRGPSAAGRE